MKKIGFIGMGNMGYALLKGCSQKYSKDDFIIFDSNTERLEEVASEFGIAYASSNAELLDDCKVVVLAIKPQVYNEVIEPVADHFRDDHIIISLAPGKTVENVSNMTTKGRVVRTMPNTPALVNAGMTGICYDETKMTDEEIDVINSIFESIGKFKKVDESLMDVVVCASGSSPAYVFMFIDELAKSCEELGMDKQDAIDFVSQTVFGSAKLLMETGEDPQVLKERVCSPGGTTIEGVHALEENDFGEAIRKATQACNDKCKKL